MTRILFFVLPFISVFLFGQSCDQSQGTIKPMKTAEYAQSAMEEYNSTTARGPKYWQMIEHRGFQKEVHLRADPYLPWLQFRLLHGAMSGELFVQSQKPDNVTLRMTWEMADNEAWYVCVLESSDTMRNAKPALQATLIWPSYGDLVTPDGPGDDPTMADYPLVGVSSGDLVRFDLYRLPRDYARHNMDIDPAEAIKSDSAELVIRMTLPVITKP